MANKYLGGDLAHSSGAIKFETNQLFKCDKTG
jgi:hypothetical protein